MNQYNLTPIAHIRSDFPEKFGIPRQSGLIESLQADIIFLPKYQNPDALRGLDGYSHIWIIWCFSKANQKDWTPTVRPPKLGGNERMGVFATRSPFRPNSLGLSCVKLEGFSQTAQNGVILHVSGADLLDGTPIFDIKPYLTFTDCHPEACNGFATPHMGDQMNVHCSSELLSLLPPSKQESLLSILAQDPRPSYQEDSDRIYGMKYAGFEIKFRVRNSLVTVVNIALDI